MSHSLREMRKDWRMPNRRSLMTSRLVHPVLGFTFPSLTQTCTCQPYWRAFLDQRSGWRQDWEPSAADPEVRRRHLRPGSMECGEEDLSTNGPNTEVPQ